MTILDEMVETVHKRVKKEKNEHPVDEMKIESYEGKSLVKEIKSTTSTSVIGEVKKTSPTSEVFRKDFHPSGLAKSISEGGAAGVSVLTEPSHFEGSLNYLEEVLDSVNVPVLRKDFIVDEYQLYQSAEVGADSVLLISEVLEKQLSDFVDLSRDLGMEPLVEISSKEDLKFVESAGAELIGINNRNLNSMEIDISRTEKFLNHISGDFTFVSESGIEDRADVNKVSEAGADAVLVGTAIMESTNVREKVRSLGG